ncbi:MAG: hypothetical protein WCO71_09210, partial [Pseudomonadota bacterium]
FKNMNIERSSRRGTGMIYTILHHLREIERRRLFVDLSYNSLFDYAVGELKYSEGQAGRRIAAMRLLKDLPADAAARIETKITTGALSLSNVQQARSFFRDQSAAEPRRVITAAEKLNVQREPLPVCRSRLPLAVKHQLVSLSGQQVGRLGCPKVAWR